MPASALPSSPVPKLMTYVELDNALAKPITKAYAGPPKLEGGVACGLPNMIPLKIYVVNQRILSEIIEGKHKELSADKLAILDLRTKGEGTKQIKGAKHLPLEDKVTSVADDPAMAAVIRQGYTNGNLVRTVLDNPKVSHIVVYCAQGQARSVSFVREFAKLYRDTAGMKGKKICIVPGGFTAYENDAAVKASVTPWAG